MGGPDPPALPGMPDGSDTNDLNNEHEAHSGSSETSEVDAQKAFHSAFHEECSRGVSPTSAALKILAQYNALVKKDDQVVCSPEAVSHGAAKSAKSPMKQ